MPNWIKKLFGVRPTFGGKHTPTIPSKFPRLKDLDRRVAAARGIVCHPIQHGICDTHRHPIYATEEHRAHERSALGVSGYDNRQRRPFRNGERDMSNLTEDKKTAMTRKFIRDADDVRERFMDELTAENAKVLGVQALNAELVEALDALMGGDEKMQVGIGGNPNYVNAFISRTNLLLEKAKGLRPYLVSQRTPKPNCAD
jgi:hypothetical protein